MTTKKLNLSYRLLDDTVELSANPDHRLRRRTVALAPATEGKRMLSVDEFCHRYGIGRTKAYAEMAAGRLAYCPHGNRLIHIDDAEAWALSTRKPRTAPDPGPSSIPGAV